MFYKRLGIDLGTANSVVWLAGEGIVLNEPTVVTVSVEDNRVIAVGGEAKRMLKQGGVRINEDRIVDPNHQIIPADGMVVRVGKRKIAKLKVS